MVLLAKLKGYLIAAGAVLVAIIGVFLQGRKSAKNEIEVKETKEALKTVKRANEIKDDIRDTSDDQLNDRLRKYQRKK